MHSLEEYDAFGTAVASMGDWDGNGEVDVAVGALEWGKGGGVYILLMGPQGYPVFEKRIKGLAAPLQENDFFGASLACPGDLDGDGVRDLIVGAPGDDDGGTRRGALYILWLETSAQVKKEQKITSTQGGGLGLTLRDDDLFGRRVTVVGDLDKDDMVDVVVGSINIAHLLLLNADGTVKNTTRLMEFPILGTKERYEWADHRLGAGGVAAVGDVDGDGISEIVVGQPGGGDSGDKVHVLFMGEGGSIRKETIISATSGGLKGPLVNGDNFGADGIAGLGDLDGDGTPDIAVGAVNTGLGIPGRKGKGGAVYILCLTPTGEVKAEQIIAGNHRGGLIAGLSSGDNFGVSIAALVAEEEWTKGEGGVRAAVTLVVGANRETSTVSDGGGIYILKCRCCNDGG